MSLLLLAAPFAGIVVGLVLVALRRRRSDCVHLRVSEVRFHSARSGMLVAAEAHCLDCGQPRPNVVDLMRKFEGV